MDRGPPPAARPALARVPRRPRRDRRERPPYPTWSRWAGTRGCGRRRASTRQRPAEMRGERGGRRGPLRRASYGIGRVVEDGDSGTEGPPLCHDTASTSTRRPGAPPTAPLSHAWYTTYVSPAGVSSTEQCPGPAHA